jgi:hypothetical protein
MPSYDQYGGETVTLESIQQSTLRGFGDGVTDVEDAERIANRKSAFGRFYATQGADPRPGAPRDDVQVDMDRDSRRYPDGKAG